MYMLPLLSQPCSYIQFGLIFILYAADLLSSIIYYEKERWTCNESQIKNVLTCDFPSWDEEILDPSKEMVSSRHHKLHWGEMCWIPLGYRGWLFTFLIYRLLMFHLNNNNNLHVFNQPRAHRLSSAQFHHHRCRRHTYSSYSWKYINAQEKTNLKLICIKQFSLFFILLQFVLLSPTFSRFSHLQDVQHFSTFFIMNSLGSRY